MRTRKNPRYRRRIVSTALLLFAGAPLEARDGNLRGALDRLQRGFAEGVLHGTAVVLRPGEPALYAASGLASVGGAELERSSRFRIASLTKIVTQVAVLRLVDAGRVELDAPLATYRPGLAAEWAASVTVRQLLTFRSGLPRERPAAGAIESGVVFDAQGAALSFLDGLGDIGPTVAPDAATTYSNLGYMHVGALLEAVTGKPIEGALRELVLDPVGMASTGLHGADELDGVVHVRGYRRAANGELEAVEPFPVSVRYTAGGLYSSVEDLDRLSLAILGREFLKPESRALLFSGFGRHDDGRIRATGRIPGFAGVWLLSSDPPFAIVSLNNVVPADPDAIVELVSQAAGRLAPVGSSGAQQPAPIEDEGWKRVPSLQAVPAHPLLTLVEDYLATFGAGDSSALCALSIEARGLDPEALSEAEREGYALAAKAEYQEFHAHGPFRLAAWRLGEADRLELYLEGPEGRALTYRFRPSPQDPRRALSIAYETIGFASEPESPPPRDGE